MESGLGRRPSLGRNSRECRTTSRSARRRATRSGMSIASASDLTAAESPPEEVRALHVLFFMQHLGRYLRFFDSVIRLMLDRGHSVHLIFEYEEEAPGRLVQAWLRRMERHPRFRWSVSHAWRRDPWFRVARRVRLVLDYVYFL